MRIAILLSMILLFTPGTVADASPMEDSYEGNPIIVINLTYESGIGGGDDFEGEIVLELFLNWAPITVTNFVDLVNHSFYDGIFCGRIIDDFVIQSGDPDCNSNGVYPISDPSCGEGGSSETIPFEADANLTHINGAIGMAIIGKNGEWLQVNERICKMLDYSSEELKQKTFQEITHPDDLEIDLDLLKKLESGAINNYQIKKRYFRKDGSILAAVLGATALRNDKGEVKYYISQIIDCTSE